MATNPLSLMADDEETFGPPTPEAEEEVFGPTRMPGGLSGLDVPGAAEALATMARSSQQARAALQRAREQIAARRYPRSLPWFAIAGALSKPTRTGAIGETFGNLSEALSGPVREREAFKQTQEKELLGIDTQIAGLDQNAAQAQLQLAALQAKLKQQAEYSPNDIVVENGVPRYRSRPEARKSPQAYVQPPANQNLTLNTQKDFYGSLAETRSKSVNEAYEAAQAAPQSMERAHQIKGALKQGAITGTLADAKLAIAKAAKAFGWSDADDWVANTETMASQLAKGTLDLIGPSKLGGGSGFSNADRDFLDKVSGNKLSLDGKSIDRLMDLHIKAQQNTVKKWNGLYDRLDRKQLDIMGFTKVELPTFGEEPAEEAVAPTGAQPQAAAAPPAAAGDAPYGYAPERWSVDPSAPPPRASPQAEADLRANPGLAPQFLEKYKYLPTEL